MPDITLNVMDVLLVDDDPHIRDMLVQLLEDEGYNVLSAANGRDAVELLRGARELPRVIVLDLMMPVMNGWEFRATQRQDPSLAPIPVIVLSADHQVPRHAAELQVQAYLQKPVDFDALLRLVGNYTQG